MSQLWLNLFNYYYNNNWNWDWQSITHHCCLLIQPFWSPFRCAGKEFLCRKQCTADVKWWQLNGWCSRSSTSSAVCPPAITSYGKSLPDCFSSKDKNHAASVACNTWHTLDTQAHNLICLTHLRLMHGNCFLVERFLPSFFLELHY